MNGTYLTTAYRDKDQVKALGARWDPARRQWYVPAGMALEAFRPWLPAAAQDLPAATLLADPAPALAVMPAAPFAAGGQAVLAADLTASELTPLSGALAVPRRGMPLSQLLGGVAQAVSAAFSGGVWTTIEVVDTRVRNGHVYLEASERDAQGIIIAKATAVIWASVAQRILPVFEQATGAQLGPGIKLLVRARPVFKAQYGFSLDIDAIDAEYTLGDLEARKREIRERLQREGLWTLNRALPRPWDYQHLVVIAPEGGAGLGDFQAEASRLQAEGVCQFFYATSRFQGTGAADEIRLTLASTLENIRLNHRWHPDAVVIIRGGGAVNDMAWLNDYALVRAVCELDIPVLTGIGHERDNTLLDEVANLRFDTPSKVIAGIEQTIVQRAREAQALFERIAQTAVRTVEAARQGTAEMFAQTRLGAVQRVHAARQAADADLQRVRHAADQQLRQAHRDVPALMGEIRAEARQALRTAESRAAAEWRFITERSATDLRHLRESVIRARQDFAAHAFQSLGQARQASQALMREIAGQGPEKTLNRGFAVVRDPEGRVVTQAASPASEVTLEFRDGRRAAVLQPKPPTP